MRYLKGLFAVLLIIGMYTSCETDFELNAPYEKTAVIFGFLEISADTQYFRIQKTFLGEGDAILFAGIEDSSLFDSVEGRIYWTNENGDQLGQASMDSITVHNKDTDGIFFAPTQLMYYIPSSEIEFNTDHIYNLEVIADGEIYTSSTRLVEMLSQNIQQPPSDAGGLEIAMVTGSGAALNYLDKKVRFTTIDFARRYDLLLKFYYTDHKISGDVPRTFNFNIGDVITNSDNGGAIVERVFDSEVWYKQIGDLNDSNQDIIYRSAGKLDYIITLAAEDLHNYITINEPVTGIVQNRPEYTNITKGDGGSGIGIFSSRFTIVRTKYLNTNSMREMACGQYTEADLFCDPNSGDFQCGSGFECF